jgi:hypothetical protein
VPPPPPQQQRRQQQQQQQQQQQPAGTDVPAPAISIPAGTSAGHSEADGGGGGEHDEVPGRFTTFDPERVKVRPFTLCSSWSRCFRQDDCDGRDHCKQASHPLPRELMALA